jgi:mannose-6-phosphate isomerase-like protein (cupin superfamily)
MPPDNKVNLRDKLALLDKPWSPRVVAELNGQHVRIGRFEGEFLWHSHENEDELFLVVDGEIEIHVRDEPGAERIVHLSQGELFVVPRGVEHKPVARGSAGVMMFEPASTRTTGGIDDERTIEASDLERI